MPRFAPYGVMAYRGTPDDLLNHSVEESTMAEKKIFTGEEMFALVDGGMGTIEDARKMQANGKLKVRAKESTPKNLPEFAKDLNEKMWKMLNKHALDFAEAGIRPAIGYIDLNHVPVPRAEKATNSLNDCIRDS